MNSSDFAEIVSRATDAVLKTDLQAILSEGDIDDILQIVGFLRKKLYVTIDPHFITGSIFLCLAKSGSAPRGTLITDLGVYAGQSIDSMVFELHRNGRVYELANEEFDPTSESVDAHVYEYSKGRDIFWIDGNCHIVPATDPNSDSQFCGRTFFDLSSALDEYARLYALPCKCPVLQSAWHTEARLFFKPKPEATLRNSLKHFLDVRLAAGYEVRAEQNMDGTHPVDIKVSKQLQPRLMIIEIKWLGDSISPSGGASNISHRDQKAIDGAHQLASYLDANKIEAPNITSVGYYVIFDGRRKGLSLNKMDYKTEDLLYYEHIEVDFQNAEVLKRSDFVQPLRMFIRPKIGVIGSRAVAK